MSYAVTPTLSVDAFQARSTLVELTAVARRLVGSLGGVVSEVPYWVLVPTSLIAPTRFPEKSFVPTNVRLHSEWLMLRPYLCVFVAWLSVAVFASTRLSSQVIESPEVTWIPSRLATSSELFVTVFPVTRFRSLLWILIPFSPALLMVFPMMTLSFDFLLGWAWLAWALVASIPSLTVSWMKHPSTRLLVEARNWIPSLFVPLISQLRTVFPWDVHPPSLPWRLIPFPGEAVF